MHGHHVTNGFLRAGTAGRQQGAQRLRWCKVRTFVRTCERRLRVHTCSGSGGAARLHVRVPAAGFTRLLRRSDQPLLRLTSVNSPYTSGSFPSRPGRLTPRASPGVLGLPSAGPAPADRER